MKALYRVFCLLFFVLSSCNSESSSDPVVNPNLLQRVDFYPGLASERRWLFNTDGLLDKITKADATVVQDFTYDANNRLTDFTLNENGLTEVHTFTYDSNDFVTSVDGATVNYDATLNAYYTGNLNQSYRLTKINSEKVLIEGKTVFIETDETGTNTTEWYAINAYYSGGNLSGYSFDDSCNSLTFDSNTNPLRNATLSIYRAFSFIYSSRWIDGQLYSANNALSHHYCSEDPESEMFNYTYNSNNLPITKTKDNYYLGVYENSVLYAKYYYQGDVIP